MKIFCWNVNGWTPTVNNIKLKYGSLAGFFDHYSIDLFCIQEAKIPEDKLSKEIACVEGFESFWSICKKRKGYSGVATYVKQEYGVIHAEIDSLGGGDEDIDQEGRCVITDHGTWVLINVYVPNAGHAPERSRVHFKIKFLNALYSTMVSWEAKGKKVILVGDLNVCISPKDVHKEKKWEELYTAEELEVASKIFAKYTDIWRLQHQEEDSVFTVWDERKNHRPLNIGQRIDFILCSCSLLSQLGNCEVVFTPPKWSDHAAVVGVFDDLEGKVVDTPHALSSRSSSKFNDRSQPTILSMLGKRKLDDDQAQKVDRDIGGIIKTEENRDTLLRRNQTSQPIMKKQKKIKVKSNSKQQSICSFFTKRV